MIPRLLLPGDRIAFPDPRRADEDGLVAVGGDLSPERLLAAYRAGIFPWFSEGQPPLWWSPDPRAVLSVTELHVPRRLRDRLRRGDFELRWNTDFEAVMRACGEQREEGTWITEEMLAGYGALHRRGVAHALAVHRGGELVGGIYGVQIGAVFAAESMFHRATDMSKVALVRLVERLAAAGVELLEVQFLTPFLAQFGVREIPRASYLQRLAELRDRRVEL